MKKFFLLALTALLCAVAAEAKPKKLTATLKWDVTPEGTLVISGYGEMPDWATPQNEAWYKENKWRNVKKIVLEEGVTSIGFKSFSPVGAQFTHPASIEISLPSTLREIGDFAFKGTHISDLQLPTGLRRIGLGAFSGSLTQGSLELPSTLVAISDGAFMRCEIINVTFNSDVVVGGGTFFECKPLQTVNFNSTWTELAGGAFEGDHQLVEIQASDNIRIPGGNPFIRTPLERSTIILAHMGAMNPQPAAQMARAEEGEEGTVKAEEPEVPLSELDRNIPVMDGIDRDNTFALVIGNENYRREAAVPFAANDAKIFAEYLKQTLGIPEKNVHVITDASLNDMKYGLNLMAKLSNAYEGNVSFIVYYAGHGVPDEATKDAFLLPVDGYGADSSTGYPISTLYDRLAGIPSRSTVLFMDACFSGAKREGEMMASARGVAIAPKTAQAKGNLVVFTAASGEETAFAYKEQGHGMFTYFLLKKLQQNMGDVSLGELGDYIIANVKQSSIRENQKSQTPTVSAPEEMGELWRELKL